MKIKLLSVSIVSSLFFACSGPQIQKRDVSNLPMPIALPFQVANTVAKAEKKLDVPLKTFTIGKRPQRVRFYIAGRWSEDLKDGALVNINVIQKDEVFTSYASSFVSQANYPYKIGKESISENSDIYGLVVSPNLLNCYLSMLNMLKKVGDKYPAIIDRWQIDEVNIFLKIVSYEDQIKATDNKLEINPVASNPRDPAIDIKIPYITSTDTCMLPVVNGRINELEKGLLDADRTIGRP